MYICDNMLSGEVPASLAKCTKLEKLWLGSSPDSHKKERTKALVQYLEDHQVLYPEGGNLDLYVTEPTKKLIEAKVKPEADYYGETHFTWPRVVPASPRTAP